MRIAQEIETDEYSNALGPHDSSSFRSGFPISRSRGFRGAMTEDEK